MLVILPKLRHKQTSSYPEVSENDQELLQSHTAVQHREEEPQNIYSNNTQGGQSRGQSDWVHGLYELVIGHHR